MDKTLQYQTITRWIDLPNACPGDHHTDGPKASDALTLKVEQSNRTDKQTQQSVYCGVSNLTPPPVILFNKVASLASTTKVTAVNSREIEYLAQVQSRRSVKSTFGIYLKLNIYVKILKN